MSTRELLDSLMAIVQELKLRNQDEGPTNGRQLVFQEGARVKCTNRRSDYYQMVGTLIGKTPCFWEVRFDAITRDGGKFVRKLKQDSLEVIPPGPASPQVLDPYSRVVN